VTKFWLAYEVKVVLVFAFILVAVLSFEVGLLQGQKFDQKPLIIEKPISTPGSQKKVAESQISPPETTNKLANQDTQTCAFVGSKNSNKYHLPTCRWAKRIKPENIVCFKSTEDAVAKNYQPDKGCIK